MRQDARCVLCEDWNAARLVEMDITADGNPRGWCEGESSFKAFLSGSEDLLRNINGLEHVAVIDGDESRAA